MTEIDENAPSSVCSGCGQRIDPEDPDTVHAVEVRKLPAMGETHTVDGMPALFHRGCYPDGPGYRLAQ